MKVKVDLALAKGKKLFDKRETLKREPWNVRWKGGEKGSTGIVDSGCIPSPLAR